MLVVEGTGRGIVALGFVVDACVLVIRQGLIYGLLQHLQKPAHVAAVPVGEMGLKTLRISCDNYIHAPSRVPCIHLTSFPSCGFLETEVFPGYL